MNEAHHCPQCNAYVGGNDTEVVSRMTGLFLLNVQVFAIERETGTHANLLCSRCIVFAMANIADEWEHDAEASLPGWKRVDLPW